jgi:DNA-binding NtrC family response regulator
MTPVDLKAMLRAFELQYIQKALKASNGVKARAAKLLGMKRSCLVERMRRHSLPLNLSNRKKFVGTESADEPKEPSGE